MKREMHSDGAACVGDDCRHEDHYWSRIWREIGESHACHESRSGGRDEGCPLCVGKESAVLWRFGMFCRLGVAPSTNDVWWVAAVLKAPADVCEYAEPKK